MQTYLSNRSVVKALVLASSLSLALTSCQDEEFGYDISDVRESVYARNFTELFGEVDPNHTWNMAQCAHVNINVSGATGYQVRILTEVPTNRETVLLYQGTMNSDELSVDVDVVRGSQYVYVELSSSFGVTLVDGYFRIEEDGTVMVSNVPTRAGATPPLAVPYETQIERISRIWDPTKNPGSTYVWTYGFTQRITNRISGDGGKVPTGWTIKYKNVDIEEGTYLGDGNPRIITNYNKPDIFGQTSNDTKTLFLCGSDTKATLKQSYFIPSGPVRIHLLLARGNSTNKATNVRLELYKNGTPDNFSRDGQQGKVSYIDYYNFGQVNIAPNNVNSFDDKIVDISVDGGNYTLVLSLLQGQNGQGSVDPEGIVCAGIQIEPRAPRLQGESTELPYCLLLDDKTNSYTDGSGYYHYMEQVIGGYISYRDVMGGTVDRTKKDPYLQFRTDNNGKTYRNNLNGGGTYYNYSTYDLTKMKDASAPQIGIGSLGPFYIIDGDVTYNWERVKYRDLFNLFGMYKSSTDGSWKAAPFREGDNHIDPYFDDENGHRHSSEFQMSGEPNIETLGKVTDANGVSHDGSVTIKLVGKGTDHLNDVGYFYYPKDQESSLRDQKTGTIDFNKIPKVIIRRDMQSALRSADMPASWNGNGNLPQDDYIWNFQFSRYIDVCYLLSLDNAGSEALNAVLPEHYDNKKYYNQFKNNTEQRKVVADAGFDAPIYKLPYYGFNEQGGKIVPNNTPSYEWPAGYVIGFFGIRRDDDNACELSRIYTTSAKVQLNIFNDLPRGSSFSYKGKNYIGIEDEWDYDNNDFLFEVQGIKPIDPNITPPDDQVEPPTTVQRWVVACEDLGGSWDYDFNDLVWEVSKEVVPRKSGTTWVTDTKISWRPLAAGGTLEAIVQYNGNKDLDVSTAETGWRDLGEIHNLVKRTPNKKSDGSYETPTNKQLNVDPRVNPTEENCGKLEELTTLSGVSSDNMTMANILTHFRVLVKYPNGTSYPVRNVGANLQSSQSHDHDGNHDYPNANKAPQFILLPRGWRWPAEAVCIDNAYPSFTDWTKSQGSYPNWVNDWNNAHGNGDGAVIINPFRD